MFSGFYFLSDYTVSINNGLTINFDGKSDTFNVNLTNTVRIEFYFITIILVINR